MRIGTRPMHSCPCQVTNQFNKCTYLVFCVSNHLIKLILWMSLRAQDQLICFHYSVLGTLTPPVLGCWLPSTIVKHYSPAVRLLWAHHPPSWSSITRYCIPCSTTSGGPVEPWWTTTGWCLFPSEPFSQNRCNCCYTMLCRRFPWMILCYWPLWLIIKWQSSISCTISPGCSSNILYHYYSNNPLFSVIVVSYHLIIWSLFQSLPLAVPNHMQPIKIK